MALEKLVFTKNWNDPNDFPTVETSEANVRHDMQLLHDEARAAINDIVDELENTGAADIGATSPVPGGTAMTVQGVLNEMEGVIDANTAARHTHDNKALLDTYDQTNADITSAVDQKHSHANKALLDTYTQTEANLATAVEDMHTHANKSLLDSYDQTNADVKSAVDQRHSHSNKALLDTYTQTEENLATAVADMHVHENKALLDTYTQTETNLASAVSQKHSHANKALLDTYTQTDVDIASAVSQKHTHNNKSLLDDYDQTNADLTDAVTKKHSHSNKSLLDTYTQTEDNLADAVSKKHTHANKSTLDGIGGLDTSIVGTASNTHVATSKAIQDFVNSSIAASAANYISDNGEPFTSVADLEAYSGTVSKNDYAIVVTTSGGSVTYSRYKYDGTSWAKEYDINNSAYTQAQWDAIDSGITSAKVSSYDSHIASTSNPHSVTKAQVGLGNVDNTSDTNKPISTATQTALDGKADLVTDGVAGNFASLDSDGNLDDSGIPVEQTATATGAIATFESREADIPLQDLSLAINPVQNLNGYDNPWPAGGGAQLLDISTAAAYNTGGGKIKTSTSYGTVTKENNGIKGTSRNASYANCISLGYLSAGTYTISVGTVVGDISVFTTGQTEPANDVSVTGITPDSSTTTSITFTIDTAEYVSFALYQNNTNDLYCTNIMLVTGSTATSFAPYENVCPISGFTGVDITRTGKNLFDASSSTRSQLALSTWAGDGNLVDSNSAYSVVFPCKQNTTYTVSKSAGNRFRIMGTEIIPTENGFAHLLANDDSAASLTVNSGNNNYLLIYLANGTYDFATLVSSLQIELGQTASAYEAYSGNVYNIDWTDEAGTVYGGTDKPTTGELDSTMTSVDLGTLYWNATADGFYADFAGTPLKKYATGETPKILCSAYKTAPVSALSSLPDMAISQSSNNAKRIILKDTNHLSSDIVDGYAAFLDGVQLVYTNATPVTYQLDAVTVATLLGQNNIWHDANGDTTATYLQGFGIDLFHKADLVNGKVPLSEIPSGIDAATLNGHAGTYFATPDSVSSAVSTAVSTHNSAADAHSSLFAAKADASALTAHESASDAHESLFNEKQDILTDEAANSPSTSSFDVTMANGAIGPVLDGVFKGKTAAINQLVQNGNFADGTTNWLGSGATISVSNKVLTMTATAQYGGLIQSGIKFTKGHVYAIACKAKGTSSTSLTVYTSTGHYFNGLSVSSSAVEYGDVRTYSPNTGAANLIFQDNRASDWDAIQFENVMIKDITLELGETTANAIAALTTGAERFAAFKSAWLKKFGYPLPQYIPYNPGSIVSNNAKYQLCGRNLWDEQTRIGTYSTTTGAYDSSYSDRLCDVNLSPCEPNKTYYFRTTSGLTVGNVYFYDHNEDFISAVTGKGNNTFTAPSNACYFHISLGGTYGMTYNHDICINLSDASFNGTYEPYHDGGSVDLSAIGLNGFDDTVCDTYNSVTGKAKRNCTEIDLGADLSWTYGQHGVCYATLSGVKLPSALSALGNFICGRLVQVTTASVPAYSDFGNYQYCVTNNSRIYAKLDDSITTAAAFTTAVTGVILVAELATPTEETVAAQPLETQEGYNILEPVSGDIQSGAVSLKYYSDPAATDIIGTAVAEAKAYADTQLATKANASALTAHESAADAHASLFAAKADASALTTHESSASAHSTLFAGKADTVHTQAASTITAGTLAGKTLANATAQATLADQQVRNIYIGTASMTAGVSELPAGCIYIQYIAE